MGGLGLTLPSGVTGDVSNPTQQIGPRLNRIVRDPALMLGGATFLGLATQFMQSQNYSPDDVDVFLNPGRDLDQRIQSVWDQTNALADQLGIYATPDMFVAAQNAELALRNFGVESYNATGELFTTPWTAEEQAPLNNLMSSHMDGIRSLGRTREDARFLMEGYADHWGIDPADVPAEQWNEIARSQNPMDIVPETEVRPPRTGPITVAEAMTLVDTDPDGNLRVTGAPPPQLPCRVGTYRQLAGTCGPGREAHHIIPDYAKRYGTRKQGIRGENRIPGLPAYWEGMAICLTGNARSRTGQHGIAHRATDPMIAARGASPNATVPGTTTFGEAALAGAAGVIAARPECATVVVGAVTTELIGRRPGQLVNANPAGPPVGTARAALMVGQ